MHLLLVLARFALGPSLSLLLLLLRETQDNQTQLDPLELMSHPDWTAKDCPIGGVEPFEPIYDDDLGSLLIFHREHACGYPNNDGSLLGFNKGNAFPQAIGSIGHHQIPWLQIKDLQMLCFFVIRDFDLREPTSQQIKGGMCSHDNPFGTQTLPMGSIDQQDPPQTCSDEPRRDEHCYG